MQHPFQRTQYTKTGRPLTQEARFSTDSSGARRFNRHNLIGKRSGLRSVFSETLNLTDSPPAPLSTFRKFVGNLHLPRISSGSRRTLLSRCFAVFHHPDRV